jgi:hypothetical protein
MGWEKIGNFGLLGDIDVVIGRPNNLVIILQIVLIIVCNGFVLCSRNDRNQYKMLNACEHIPGDFTD